MNNNICNNVDVVHINKDLYFKDFYVNYILMQVILCFFFFANIANYYVNYLKKRPEFKNHSYLKL